MIIKIIDPVLGNQHTVELLKLCSMSGLHQCTNIQSVTFLRKYHYLLLTPGFTIFCYYITYNNFRNHANLSTQ